MENLAGHLAAAPAAASSGEAYDYVIVGGGSAGAVLAARLSEDKNVRVLLVEAGGEYAGAPVTTPLRFAELQLGKLDWQYKTEKNPHMADRVLFWPRGKILGGSSAINAMLWVRCHPEDYDGWERAGCTGWGFQSLLPYFKRAENSHVEQHDAELRGDAGPIHVGLDPVPNVYGLRFLNAAKEIGIPVTPDYNGKQPEGVGRTQQNVHGGKRQSTANCYLSKEVRARRNLVIKTRVFVTRVILNGTTATGIEFKSGSNSASLKNAPLQSVSAKREVILCGGSIGSPAILMHSGIGNAEELEKVGIKVAHNLPGVGKNLRDHLVLNQMHEVTDSESISEFAVAKLLGGLAKYTFTNRGFLAAAPVPVMIFTRSGVNAEMNHPDLQFHFIPAMYVDPRSQVLKGSNLANSEMAKLGVSRYGQYGISIMPTLLHPHSIGELRLRSSDPLEHPIIDARCLTDSRDVDVLVRGLELARKMAASSAFEGKIKREVLDHAIQHDPASREYMEAYVRRITTTIFHPVGTCKMGVDSDQSAVVDLNLCVRGITGLRVVDASVFPTLLSGNTNAPVIAFAERAADIIRGKIKA